MKNLDSNVEIASKVVATRLDAKTLKILEATQREKNMSASAVVRLWIADAIAHSHEPASIARFEAYALAMNEIRAEASVLLQEGLRDLNKRVTAFSTKRSGDASS